MSKPRDLETSELVGRAASVARGDPAAESEARWELVRELQARPEEAVFRAAVGWCGARELALRCLGADVLGQLGYEASYPFARQSAPVLGALFGDANAAAVASALVACGHLGVGDTAAVCALAEHADEGVRLAVAICLGGREAPQAISTLIALSSDADRDVRNWATFGLGSVSERDAPAIRDALAARLSEEDHEIRGEAILGLARRGDRRATKAILAELGAGASVLVIEAAGVVGDAAFVPELEALLAENPGDGAVLDALQRCRAATASA